MLKFTSLIMLIIVSVSTNVAQDVFENLNVPQPTYVEMVAESVEPAEMPKMVAKSTEVESVEVVESAEMPEMMAEYTEVESDEMFVEVPEAISSLPRDAAWMDNRMPEIKPCGRCASGDHFPMDEKDDMPVMDDMMIVEVDEMSVVVEDEDMPMVEEWTMSAVEPTGEDKLKQLLGLMKKMMSTEEDDDKVVEKLKHAIMHQLERVTKGCDEDISSFCRMDITKEMVIVIEKHPAFPRMHVAMTAISCLDKHLHESTQRCQKMVSKLDTKTKMASWDMDNEHGKEFGSKHHDDKNRGSRKQNFRGQHHYHHGGNAGPREHETEPAFPESATGFYPPPPPINPEYMNPQYEDIRDASSSTSSSSP